MRGLLIFTLVVAGCDLATEDGGGAVGGAADAGPSDLTPPDEECPAYGGTGMVCLGSFEVRNFADIELVAPCAHITGDLDVGDNGLVEIELPLLERVDGTLTIQPGTSLERIALPELKEVGGALIGVPPVLELVLPRLRTVGSDLRVPESTSSPSVSLPCLDTAGTITGPVIVAPRLTIVTGGVQAGLQAPLLTRIVEGIDYQDTADLPALIRVGAITLVEADSIALPSLRVIDSFADLGCAFEPHTAATLSLPSLLRAGGIRLCPWPALTSVELPALVRILGPASLGGLYIGASATLGPVEAPSLLTVTGTLLLNGQLAAPALESVSGSVVQSDSNAPELRLPQLVSIGGDLRILRNPITDIDFGSLSSLGGSLIVRANPNLPTCQAEALRDQLVAAGWAGAWVIANNGTGTCP